MSNYELYEKVIEAYKSGEDIFNAAARNWIEGTEEAKFESEEANELYRKAQYYRSVWRSKAINSRVSKIRMIECVRRIAEMDLPNPYPKTKVLGVVPDEVKIVDDPEAIKGSAQAEKKAEKVLGVVPEEKPKGFFRRHREEPKEVITKE